MIDKIKKQLESTLKPSRYQHSLNVADEAVKLGKRYSYDTDDCYIAGLLHDIAKVKDDKILDDLLDTIGYKTSDEDRKNMSKNPSSHAIIGAYAAEKLYGIEDEDILNSIKYHTTGRVGMSLLEKIVYLADYIAEGRSFDGLERARELAYKDIDEAMIFSLSNNIIHVVKKGKILKEDTIKARNYFIEKKI